MSGYKLADGSLSTGYAKGDSFTISAEGCSPDRVTCAGHDGEWCVTNAFTWFGIRSVKWDILTPTAETKSKVAERKRYAEEAADAMANQRGHINREEANSIADAVSKARREGSIITGFEYNEDDRTVKCTTKPMDKAKPLARIVDWRESERGDIAVSKFEENETWVLNGDHDHEGALNTECGEWIAQEDYHLIRINTDALPKQRTLTIAEAEREFGVKIINDNSKH